VRVEDIVELHVGTGKDNKRVINLYRKHVTLFKELAEYAINHAKEADY